MLFEYIQDLYLKNFYFTTMIMKHIFIIIPLTFINFI